MLQRFTLQGRDSMLYAIEEVGGLLVVPRGADPDEVRMAVLEEGALALIIQTPEVDFLEGLPVEFAFSAGVFPPAEAVNGLRELRGLSLDFWEGDEMSGEQCTSASSWPVTRSPCGSLTTTGATLRSLPLAPHRPNI